MAKLTARKVATLKEPGRYGDGQNLYLQITNDGVRSWLLRYQQDGAYAHNVRFTPESGHYSALHQMSALCHKRTSPPRVNEPIGK